MYKKNTILITGASRGIGKAIALKFAGSSPGSNIIITCNTNTEMLNSVRDSIADAGCACMTYTGTLADSSNVDKLSEKIYSQFKSVDILINNAGISYFGLLSDMSDSDWDNVMSSNLNSIFYCCRKFVPAMVHNHFGRIINISSVWGSTGASCEVAYSASKGAVNAFTRALARELAPSGIAVNAVACGIIDTDMNRHLSREELENIYNDIPCGRAGTPEEIADIVYSLSAQPAYMTGQVITADGGWT